jgi:hypothetical protein
MLHYRTILSNEEPKNLGVVKLKDNPNQPGTQITLIARITLHLSYSDLTTPNFNLMKFERFHLCNFLQRNYAKRF